MTKNNPVQDIFSMLVDSKTKLIVFSDIHLGARKTKASTNVDNEISKQIDALGTSGKAVVVLNGDIFELWAGENPTVQKALAAHRKLNNSLLKLVKNRHNKIVFVVGNHDGALGWDSVQQQYLIKTFNAEICFAFELNISTKQGKRAILFEHGHMLDPENAFEDPRDPHDKPFGQYLVQKALPMVIQSQGKLIKGINHLAEPHQFPKFVASRVFYRELLSKSWWLLIPIVITLAIRLIVGYDLYIAAGFSPAFTSRILVYTEVAVFFTVLGFFTAIVFILFQLLSRAKTVPSNFGPDGHHNSPGRQKAQDIINFGKNIGYITGHTHRAEIRKLQNGFYANSGCGVEMVESAKTYLKLPKTYISRMHLHWLSIEIDQSSLRINHWQMITTIDNQPLLEKMVTKRPKGNSPLSIQKQLTIEL